MSPKRPKLILFDAAGTLIEPADPVEVIYQRHFEARGWPVDGAGLKQSFRDSFSGLADPDFATAADGDAAERAWWRRVVTQTAVAAGIDPADERFEGCFEDLFGHYTRGAAWSVFPEVRAVLSQLRRRGVIMAVVSNFDRRLHQVLDELDLAEAFDLILTSADVSARKPSPRLLEAAMERFSVPPDSARLVGDSARADGGAAEAAGVPVFILDRPRTTLLDFLEWLGEDF